MALSATMALHIQGFIHSTLRLPTKCRLLKRSVNRENICYVVREMTRPSRSFEDLFFLIPPEIQSPCGIIKTMVFLDGLGEACELASALIERIPKVLYEEEPDLVAEYTNGLSAERRDYSMDLFQKGICRILVCTEACGMGVDVADVERVIQWGVTPRVNLSTIIQRMGRAARKSHMQGVGILFHTSNSVVTENHVMDAQKYLRRAEDPAYSEVQNDIVKFDLGMDECSQRINGLSSANPRSQKRRRTKEVPGNLSSGNLGGGNTKVKDFPSHCRAILSLVNTSGCRRQVILTYFGEVNITQTNPSCCDHCIGQNLSPELSRLFPPQLTTQRPVPRQSLPKRAKLPPAKQQEIIDEIKTKRRKIWHSLGGNKRFCPYAEGTLMPEKDIRLLSIRSMSITTPEHIPKNLGVLTHKYISPAHHQLWGNTFDIISTTLREPSINYISDKPDPPMSLQLNKPPTPSSKNALSTTIPPTTAMTIPPSTVLQEITASTNNTRITTHTSTGKVRKLRKSGFPRKVRSDFGKPKKKDDSRTLPT